MQPSLPGLHLCWPRGLSWDQSAVFPASVQSPWPHGSPEASSPSPRPQRVAVLGRGRRREPASPPRTGRDVSPSGGGRQGRERGGLQGPRLEAPLGPGPTWTCAHTAPGTSLHLTLCLCHVSCQVWGGDQRRPLHPCPACTVGGFGVSPVGSPLPPPTPPYEMEVQPSWGRGQAGSRAVWVAPHGPTAPPSSGHPCQPLALQEGEQLCPERRPLWGKPVWKAFTARLLPV